jgi:hypothetical protein
MFGNTIPKLADFRLTELIRLSSLPLVVMRRQRSIIAERIRIHIYEHYKSGDLGIWTLRRIHISEANWSRSLHVSELYGSDLCIWISEHYRSGSIYLNITNPDPCILTLQAQIHVSEPCGSRSIYLSPYGSKFISTKFLDIVTKSLLQYCSALVVRIFLSTPAQLTPI